MTMEAYTYIQIKIKSTKAMNEQTLHQESDNMQPKNNGAHFS